MIGALALAVGATVLAGIGMVLHRDLAKIAEHLAQASQHPPDIQRDLDQLWGDAGHLYDEYTSGVDKRLRDIEQATAQARQHQTELARYVNWMAPLVRQWAGATPERGR